ncbi:hypothetical protein M0R45_014345 [Rubus argutus]|uniref:Pentatricopeptide repeat protein n=1 Tax=Rubus argutus TaxID=59490 RepID=A0AAW1XMH0_RUBAR
MTKTSLPAVRKLHFCFRNPKAFRFTVTPAIYDVPATCFDQIPAPDLRAWAVLISAHTRHGLLMESITLYTSLRARKIAPDSLLLLSVAKACAVLGDVRNARELHNEAIRFGFQFDIALGNAMVDMFGKCKYVDGAQTGF